MAYNNEHQAVVVENHHQGLTTIDRTAGNVTSLPEGGLSSYDLTGDNQADELCTFNATSIVIIFDLNSVLTVSAIALINNNLSSTANVTIKANDNLTDLRNDISDITPIPVDTSNMTNWHRNTYKNFPQETYQYWRIDIDDASVPNGKIAIGEIIIGEFDNTPKNLNLPLSNNDTYNSLKVRNEGANNFSYLLDRSERLVITMPVLNESEFEAVKELMFRTKGSHFPFLLVPDTSRDRSYFGKFNSSTQYEYRRGRQFDARSIDFEEMSNGYITT